MGDIYHTTMSPGENDHTNGHHENVTLSNSTIIHDKTLSVDNLYPAIFQCFAIILAGYIAGRANLITQSQGKGIGIFVGKFCLPALLFKSMVELNFSQVNWLFLLGIFISKTSIFLVVMILTLLLKRPVHLGYAGLFSIFATQSNDFALGYPILQALYSSTNPEYLQYIYLIAPISLVILNPIGFTLLEIHRRKQDTTQQAGKCRIILHVVKDVLSNPIVFMVIIGMIGNVLFKQKVPYVIEDVLQVLGNAYSASALFYLGMSLVGKVQGQLGVGLIVPMLLIAAKTLLLPLITWQVVGALELNRMNETNSRSLSMYGFLYGTFPTAPSVFLYASQFSVAQDIIATGMVACTFLSAPLMFVSAKMMTMVVNSEMDYKSVLVGTSFDLSVISVVCNVWIFAVLFLSKRHRKMPHQFLLVFVFAQTFACVGMIIYNGSDHTVLWHHYVQFIILLIGVLSSRCIGAMMAVVLYLLHCRSLCFVLRIKGALYLFGIGFPIFCTGLLLIFGKHIMHDEIDPAFHYGTDQAVLSAIILVICSLINVTFLVLYQRNSKHSKDKHEIKIKSQYTSSGSSPSMYSDEESQRVGLLSADNTDIGSPRSSRASSSSKLLSTEEDGGSNVDTRRYRSQSCAECTDNCDVKLYQQTVRPNSSSIEDIVPFPSNTEPTNTKSKKVYKQGRGKSSCTQGSVNHGRPQDDRGATRSESNTSASSDDSFLDTVQNYECRNGTCDYQQRRRCAGLIRCYHSTGRTLQVNNVEEDEVKVKRRKPVDDYQTGRFLILLLVNQISMFVGLFLCTWRLFNNSKSGIYVEIEFLDCFFNYGQSLVVFAIFGFDTKLMILPCIRRWRKWMYGVEFVRVVSRSELSEEERHLCDQFIKYHRDNCKQDIVRDLKYRFRSYNDVFCGTSLCDWLVEVGLCHERYDAVTYGQTLLRGQIIAHVSKEHDFHDMPYFYRFLVEDDAE
ncbi:hypothetical protein ACF0H5_017989 [Mactra antiquata]